MDDRGFILDSDASSRDVYSQLHGQEIRTLVIAPGEPGSPVVCEMEVIASPASAQYEALSYVWGATVQARSILCNGFAFAVTESLATALMHLRYRDSWRRLWVDQLSINQDEDRELLAQVGLMGHIYSSASRVIVWLGPCDHRMAVAWELLQATTLSSSLVRSDFLHPSSSPGSPRPRPEPPIPSPSSRRSSASSYRVFKRSRSSKSRESLASSTSSLTSVTSATSVTPTRPKGKRRDTPPALKHALSIFQHVYFTRKWTFQEIVLAKAAVVCSGDREMAWSDLTLWYFHYAAKLRNASLLYDSHGAFESIIKVRNEMNKGVMSMSTLLMLTRPLQSTKPEDAVYALLGLVPDLVHKLTHATIGRSLGDSALTDDAALLHLYLMIFQHCLDSEPHLDTLSAAGRYKGNAVVAGWPSWLPDWRQPLPLRPLVLSEPTDLGPEAAFDEEVSIDPSASSSPCQGDRPPWKWTLDLASVSLGPAPRVLTLRGVRVGGIVTRSTSWPSTFLVADPTVGLRQGSSTTACEESQFSQPLAALMASNEVSTALKSRDAGPGGGYVRRLAQTYATAPVQCPSLRTSAMVETGDWLCALMGGRVLYALRPLSDARVASDNAHGQVSRRQRNGPRARGSSGRNRPSSDDRCGSRQYLFLGECVVHGLRPGEILAECRETMEFDLV